jgi:signal transduction histidine kinase
MRAMKRRQTHKNYFIQLLLGHPWLLLFFLGASTILFEIAEHWGESNPVDAHFVRETFFFGVIFPAAIVVLLRMLLRAQAQQHDMVRQQALGQQLHQELMAAQSWNDLVRLIVHFPQTVAPVVVVSLFRYMPEAQMMERVAEWWLMDNQRQAVMPTAVPHTWCGVNHQVTGYTLHPCAPGQDQPTLLSGYCLPLCRHVRFVGSLYLYLRQAALPAGSEQAFTTEQINLLNHLAPMIALAIDTMTPENPEILQATAARHERERIARQLHDTLAQSLSYLRLKLDQFTMDTSQIHMSAIYHDLARMRDIANEAYEQVRQTMVTLQSSRQDNLTDALLIRAHSMAEQAGFELNTQLYGVSLSLPSAVQRKILFIFQEALTNIYRHAQASTVTLSLTWSATDLVVSLIDNGIGFDVSHPPPYGHFGLLIMRQRAEEIQATLSVVSAVGQGTQITLHYLLLQGDAAPAL